MGDGFLIIVFSNLILRNNVFIEKIFFVPLAFVLLLILAGSLVLVYFTRHYIRLMRSRLTQQFSEIKRNRQHTPLLKIPENKGNDIISSLKQWMETDKAYLNSELRQADVADALAGRTAARRAGSVRRPQDRHVAVLRDRA